MGFLIRRGDILLFTDQKTDKNKRLFNKVKTDFLVGNENENLPELLPRDSLIFGILFL